MQRESHPPPVVLPVERPFPRLNPFPGYKPLGQYFSVDKRDHWNGKSAFPNLKFLTSDPESSKSHHEEESYRKDLSVYPMGRGYDSLGGYDAYPSSPRRPTRKSSYPNDALEGYFSHLRITPRKLDVQDGRASPGLVRPMPVRAENPFRFESSLPESDSSISGESMGTSSGNAASVNGSVGNVPERNKVVLEKIRRGLDARTTIMVKNVPNKYTQVSPPGKGANIANAHGVC